MATEGKESFPVAEYPLNCAVYTASMIEMPKRGGELHRNRYSAVVYGRLSSRRNLFRRRIVILTNGKTAEKSLKGLKKEADERLLVEAAQKDPARFGDLYELHFERVYAYVLRRVGNRTETEDVTAEVFHHALANLKRFEWRGIPFAAWLFRIAANLISDRWQRTGREVDDDAAIESAQVSPAEIEEVERRATLFRLVDTLPAEQQRVVVLRFVEQKSIKEVAREIRKTEGAVKQLQFRALTSLRARMEGADA
jgi:RNA polymerase sigma-70 factor, ECF subfamily